ncbi:hypothetical protein SAMN05216344_106106 [Polaromonas sp. OV174]|uniref:zinc ribbon domain-containing protein n=1 Tax=Polaromonas sp. OV174 TaxID=1855300 RepID=UPI0008E12D8B|nr:zinc ribbon domain-containing protein [Polaromonas sp. OV174]SFB96269.1 hypothetical protein SAMN05216344_106106 [Polaromonas sp. OV174]
MEVLIFWFAASIVVGIIASSKDRHGFGYFVLSMILSPLIAGILVLALPSLKEQAALIAGEAISPKTHVRCPDCRELVRMDARVCKHCGIALRPLGATPD